VLRLTLDRLQGSPKSVGEIKFKRTWRDVCLLPRPLTLSRWAGDLHKQGAIILNITLIRDITADLQP
jgi:hypothetical protein